MTSNEGRFRRSDIPFWRQWIGGWTLLVFLSLCIYLFRLIPSFNLEEKMPEGFLGDLTFYALMACALLFAFVVIPFLVHWMAYSCVAEPAMRLAQERMEMSIIRREDIDALSRISPGEDLVQESE